MTAPPDTPSGNRAPDGARLSALSEALLRIGASLDLETVLREAIDGARALNGAEDGCVVTIAETGEPQDFITSGMTEEEHRQIERWADGQQMFRHLRDLPGPFRIADFATFAQSLGPGSVIVTSPSVSGSTWTVQYSFHPGGAARASPSRRSPGCRRTSASGSSGPPRPR